MAEVFIGLGSNQGDRAAMLAAAVERLSEAMDRMSLSSIYESVALLPDDAPEEWNTPYLNQVLKGDAMCEPEELLALCQRIEDELGRVRSGYWGPRVIDIDILSHGQYVLETPTLMVPHPEMLNRDFVMVPLAEIAPYWSYPSKSGMMGAMAADIVRDYGYRLHEGLRKWQAEP